MKYLYKKNILRYFIELSYDGTSFHGWQRQNNAITIQQTLEEAMTMVLKESISVFGAGRTDTGVHAKKMIAHFDINDFNLEEFDFIFKINRLLPKSIVVNNLIRVNNEAHARFDAISRTYYYYISQVKEPFKFPFYYYFKEKLDWNLMNQASKVIIDHSDFKCFSKSNTDVKTFNCKIDSALWETYDNGAVFKITSNRFLRNMVRAIVGTLIEIGLRKKGLKDLKEILESRKRSNAGYSVPANGLFLTEIKYPQSIYLTNDIN